MICPEMSRCTGLDFVDCQEESCAKWRPPVGEGEGACAVVAISEDLEGLLEVLKGVVAAFLAQRKAHE